MRRARALALVALAALGALAPLATAQTPVNPIQGGYADVVVVSGRVVDEAGQPVARARLLVELAQAGVRAEPIDAATDCFGTFLTYFELKDVDRRGKVSVTLPARDGAPAATASADLDPFYRRSDIALRAPGEWGRPCEDQGPLWPVRVTVTGRILNRTEPYEVGGVEHHARPVQGPVQLVYWTPDGVARCPPPRVGTAECEFADSGRVDERGDFRYSWTFDAPLDARGSIEVRHGGQSWNFTVDPDFRQAVARIEVSGQGSPLDRETPLPSALLAPLAAAGLLALRRLLPGRRG